MVVARASGTLIASSFKQNTFLTLEVRTAGVRPGLGATGGPCTGGHAGAPERGGTGGPGTGATGGPGAAPPGGLGVGRVGLNIWGAPPHT